MACGENGVVGVTAQKFVVGVRALILEYVTILHLLMGAIIATKMGLLIKRQLHATHMNAHVSR